jgi:hypothetical protein
MIFTKNKYTKWYFNIIENAKKRLPNFEGEIHHIIPKSLGGSNKNENLVKLLHREHYICHLLLTKMLEDKNSIIKMCWALHRLTFSKTIFNSHQYEISRKIHIKNLKENHPSKKQSWRDKVSDIVYSHWENNEKRKKDTSNRMKKNWINNKEKLLEHNRNISKLGGQASKQKNSKKIEYKGETYMGWKELEEKTNISKHLYVKYYINGIDPEFRVGANGPLKNVKESQ